MLFKSIIILICKTFSYQLFMEKHDLRVLKIMFQRKIFKWNQALKL